MALAMLPRTLAPHPQYDTHFLHLNPGNPCQRKRLMPSARKRGAQPITTQFSLDVSCILLRNNDHHGLGGSSGKLYDCWKIVAIASHGELCLGGY
jgi:hypothetical protein